MLTTEWLANAALRGLANIAWYDADELCPEMQHIGELLQLVPAI